MFVKVVRTPNPVVEVSLGDVVTAKDALTAANITIGEGEGLTINGVAASLDAQLEDGDRVIVSRGAKGGL